MVYCILRIIRHFLAGMQGDAFEKKESNALIKKNTFCQNNNIHVETDDRKYCLVTVPQKENFVFTYH